MWTCIEQSKNSSDQLSSRSNTFWNKTSIEMFKTECVWQKIELAIPSGPSERYKIYRILTLDEINIETG